MKGDLASVLRALDKVDRAWTVVGPAPGLHRSEQERLRREWPRLAYALDELAAAMHGSS